MTQLQDLFTISDPMQLSLIENGVYEDLHFYLFWKDLNFKYYYANNRLAADVGLTDGSAVLNRTDLDFWPNTIEKTFQNDQKVLHERQPQLFFESGNLVNGDKINAISHKKPWYAKNGKLLGIQGLSFISILPQQNHSLSKRQLDCLYYLVKGLTIKAIAKKLLLSDRTVEHYLEAVKYKLDCYSRADLVEKALQLNLLKF